VIITLNSKRDKKRKNGVPVHKELLCYYSKYYRAALKGGFSEAESNVFEVDASHACLGDFVGWLYTGYLEPFPWKPDSATKPMSVVDMYILADRIDSLALRRSIISSLVPMPKIGNTRYTLGFHAIAVAFNSLPMSAQLCKFAIDSYVEHWQESEDDDDTMRVLDEAPTLFLYKVICGKNKLLERITKRSCVCCATACTYHEHESEEERLASEYQKASIGRWILTTKRSLREEGRR